MGKLSTRLFPLIIAVFLYKDLAAQSQNNVRQFLFNPASFNVAYTGAQGNTEIYLVHRQQWVGFDEAPKVSGLSFQHPGKKQISWGVNFLTDKAVALRDTYTTGSAAYAITIRENQSVRFGLSIGMLVRKLDLAGRDYSNDPLIMSNASGQVKPQGSFGATYKLYDLTIGFALPTLFNSEQTGSGYLHANPYSQFLNQLYSVQYKFRIDNTDFVAEPYFIYRLNRDLQNNWEVASVVTYKEKIFSGFSYESYNGVAFILGMKLNERFKISYDLEFPVSPNNLPVGTSHELQLMASLSRTKKIKKEHDTESHEEGKLQRILTEVKNFFKPKNE